MNGTFPWCKQGKLARKLRGLFGRGTAFLFISHFFGEIIRLIVGSFNSIFYFCIEFGWNDRGS